MSNNNTNIETNNTPQFVDESPEWTKNISIRSGVCPHCNQPISILMSEHTCHYCKKSVKWAERRR